SERRSEGDRSGRPTRSERSEGPDAGRRGPRSAREDRPRTVGDHPGRRKHRDPQPNRRTARPGGGNASARDESRGRGDPGCRDRDFLDERRGLSRETAERVAQHVVAAYVLEDSDPKASQAHAKFAARIGARIGAVREAYGILAYRSGDYRTAVRELRTSLRIT